jgi:dTDP-4-dehydrorhamnose reductase
MKFAIFGSKGMLGSDLLIELQGQGHETLAFSRDDFDFSRINIDQLSRKIENSEIVINSAAFTDVFAAEKNVGATNAINADFPRMLALACKKVGSRIAHVSSDYVFNGSSSMPNSTKALPNPVNVYGASKALGERYVQESGAAFTIFRTSWLYGSNGKSFPKSIISKLRNQPEVNVVNDQFGQPTWTRDVAWLMHSYFVSDFSEGIVHASSSGVTSWYDFALEIAQSKGFDQETILPVSSDELDQMVPRPKFSVLETANQNLNIGNWKERWHAAEPSF